MNTIALTRRATSVAWALAGWAFILGMNLTYAKPPPLSPSLVGDVADFPLDPNDYYTLEGREQFRVEQLRLAPDITVDLVLERFDVLAPNAVLVIVDDAGEHPAPPPPVKTYRGVVDGRPDSRAFLSVSPFAVQGWITLADKQYILSSGKSQSGLPSRLFDPSRLPAGMLPQGEPFCHIDALHEAQLVFPAPAEADEDAGSRGAAPSRCVRLAVETDHEYYTNLFASDSTAALAYIVTLTAASSEIYTRDLNTRLMVSYARVWTTADDPWTSADTESQIYEFRSYWNANMSAVSRHLTHMLSGRHLGGGIAYLTVMCNRSYGYGVSADLNGSFPYPLQNYNANNWDIFVFTHELGHNFGSDHTHCFNPPIDTCAGTANDCPHPQVCQQGTIMSYCHLCSGGIANIELAFHERCIDEAMLPHLGSASGCLPDLNCIGEIWVDFTYAGTERGTFAQPYNTLGEGVAAVATGGDLTIKASNSGPVQVTIDRTMTMRAYGGVVRIGQ